jgi:hypothetical protein
MPNRILKESICRSEEIDSLSWFEEVLFYRLIVICDDYGRYDGRAKIIKGSCFPLKDVTEKDIDKALEKLSQVGLVKVYETDGRPYIQLVTWGEHQRIRNQKSKYPPYTDECRLISCGNTKQEESVTNEQPSEVAQPIKTEEPPVITLTLNTGNEYPIIQKDIDEWMELYPAVDVMQELRAMKGWCKQNKTKRKTERGIGRFINSWLARTQNNGGTPGYIQRQNMGQASKVEQFAKEVDDWANG